MTCTCNENGTTDDESGFSLEELVPRVPYTWDGLQAGGVLDLVLASPLYLDGWDEGWLMVQVHASALVDGMSAEVILEGTSYCEDEPETTFVLPTPLASVSVPFGVGAGTLLVSRISSDLPSNGRLRLRMKQASSVPGGSHPLTLSVSLLVQAPIPGGDDTQEDLEV